MHEGGGFSAKPSGKSPFHLLTDWSGRPVLTNAKHFKVQMFHRNVGLHCYSIQYWGYLNVESNLNQQTPWGLAKLPVWKGCPFQGGVKNAVSYHDEVSVYRWYPIVEFWLYFVWQVPNVPEDNWVWSSQSAINMHLPERYVLGIRRLSLQRLLATSKWY